MQTVRDPFRPASGFLLGLLLSLALPAKVFGGDLVFDTLLYGGLERSYILFVPANYSAGEAAPMVLNLHGAGSTAVEQVLYSQLNLVADTAGFLVLIPDAVENFWNSGFDFVPPDAPDDVGFLLSLIDTVSANYSVDPDRVYSTGMSNGGFMSYRLACEAAGRFAAIASVTGSMAAPVFSSCNPGRVMPVMEVHGTSDETVLYDGDLGYASIPDVLAFWRENNDCPESAEITDLPDLVSEGCSVQRQRYVPCQDWSEVLHFRVNGGGHSWPGSFPLPGFGCTNQDIKASAEIWAFFKRHNLQNQFTGLEDTEPVKNILVYPNPASESVWIQGVETGQTFQVVDGIGRTMYSGVTEGLSTAVNITAWPSGWYRVVSTSGEQTATVRALSAHFFVLR